MLRQCGVRAATNNGLPRSAHAGSRTGLSPARCRYDLSQGYVKVSYGPRCLLALIGPDRFFVVGEHVNALLDPRQGVLDARVSLFVYDCPLFSPRAARFSVNCATSRARCSGQHDDEMAGGNGTRCSARTSTRSNRAEDCWPVGLPGGFAASCWWIPLLLSS